LAACSSEGENQNAVFVSVASSQTEVFETVVQDVNPTIGQNRIELNFGGSTTLVNQVNEGAPVSIIVVADRVAADELEVETLDEGVVSENYIVAVANGQTVPIDSFKDLTDEDLVIAACDLSVPCGRLTQRWLGAKDEIIKIDTREQNVRQVLARVESGEADVGFVYESDANQLVRGDNAMLLHGLGRSTEMSETWAVLLTDDPTTQTIFDRLLLEAKLLNGLRP
jgi:molybdate transport system substrate-binding protein